MELDGYTIEYLLREAYETIFGVTNLGDVKEPMGIVRYTNADTLGDIGSVSELVQQYRNHEILTKYGLNISEYFDMPAHIAKILVSTVKTEKQDMSEIMEDSERKAKQEMKKNR